jgi:hypothetical protein
MFQVTVLSEPNPTVTEFLHEQTTLSTVPQKKHNDNCTKTQRHHCAHSKNHFLKNNPIFYLLGLLDGLRTVLDKRI